MDEHPLFYTKSHLQERLGLSDFNLKQIILNYRFLIPEGWQELDKVTQNKRLKEWTLRWPYREVILFEEAVKLFNKISGFTHDLTLREMKALSTNTNEHLNKLTVSVEELKDSVLDIRSYLTDRDITIDAQAFCDKLKCSIHHFYNHINKETGRLGPGFMKGKFVELQWNKQANRWRTKQKDANYYIEKSLW